MKAERKSETHAWEEQGEEERGDTGGKGERAYAWRVHTREVGGARPRKRQTDGFTYL